MLKLENIDQIQDPYQLFLDSLRNEDIKRKYPRALYRFLKLIPQKIYCDNDIALSDSNNVKSMAMGSNKITPIASRANLIVSTCAAILLEIKGSRISIVFFAKLIGDASTPVLMLNPIKIPSIMADVTR